MQVALMDDLLDVSRIVNGRPSGPARRTRRRTA
jgi:hypothetical protein